MLALLGSTRPVPATAPLLRAGLRSRRLVLLKSLLLRAEQEAQPRHVRQVLAEHWELLEHAESRDPQAVGSVLEYPSVGNRLLHSLSGTAQSFGRSLEELGAIAASAGAQAGVAFRLTLPVREGRTTLPGLGGFDSRAARVTVTARPGQLLLCPGNGRSGTLLHPPYTGATADGWRPLRLLPGGRGVLDDLDPHRARWSDAGRPPVPLDGPAARLWLARYSGALRRLRAADPERATEVRGSVRALVPLAPKPGPTFSATAEMAPWAVLTSLPRSAEEMAEVLVHEVQHSKLAVLGDLIRLHHGGGAAHRVAWRPDPRPVSAVLQGTFAHLALADLWHRTAERSGLGTPARRRARAHRDRYREQVADALRTLLDSGQLTAAGRIFTKGMDRHHARLSEAMRQT